MLVCWHKHGDSWKKCTDLVLSFYWFMTFYWPTLNTIDSIVITSWLRWVIRFTHCWKYVYDQFNSRLMFPSYVWFYLLHLIFKIFFKMNGQLKLSCVKSYVMSLILSLSAVCSERKWLLFHNAYYSCHYNSIWMCIQNPSYIHSSFPLYMQLTRA